MTQNVTLLPPVGGMNLKVPLANMDPIYSPWIQNFGTDGGKLKLREAIELHADLAGTTVLSLGTYSTKGSVDSALYAWVQGGVEAVWDVTTGVPSNVYTHSATPDEVFSSNYNKRLWFGTEAANEVVYDGTTWAVDGFTISGSPVPWRSLIGYKSRAYLFYGQAADSKYYYTNTIGGVTGACSEVNLSSIFSNKGGIAWMGGFSLSVGVSNQVYLAIGDISGEVLVYSGDYPGSASWQLEGRFDIGAPIGYQNNISYNNDILVITKTGLVSVRNSFINGENSAFTDNISEQIDAYWTDLASRSTNFAAAPCRKWSGVHWKEKGKLVIMAPGFIDSAGNYDADITTFFVYDLTSKGWTLWSWDSGLTVGVSTDGSNNLTYFQGNLYFATADKIMKINGSTSTYVDTDAAGNPLGIPYAIHGAHQSLNEGSTNKKIEGFEFLLKSSEYSQFQVKCVSDFGRRISASSTIAMPSSTLGFYRLKFSVGAEGVYYQYRLEGTTNSSENIGTEVYSVVTLFNQGGNR